MKNSTRAAVLSALIVLAGAPALYAQTASSATKVNTPADNSKSNKVDPSNKTATADDQKNDAEDLKLTQAIRSSIVSDKSLSTYAHNIKVVAVNGSVTLNGVVRSQAEKDSIGAKAQSVVKAGNVTNALKIAPM